MTPQQFVFVVRASCPVICSSVVSGCAWPVDFGPGETPGLRVGVCGSALPTDFGPGGTPGLQVGEFVVRASCPVICSSVVSGCAWPVDFGPGGTPGLRVGVCGS